MSSILLGKLYATTDAYFGGRGVIRGVTQIAPSTPAFPRRVRLLREKDGLIVREKWSTGPLGAFEFLGIHEGDDYMVMAQDPTGTYRMVAFDRVRPEPMA